jgi:REP element-mobilizing transposase RayT
MKYDPGRPHRQSRRSIRLKDYDYTKSGFYFVTICSQNKAHLFGEILAKQMIRNDAGDMIHKWYYELENKFPDVKCHQMIVMPDHIHFIVEITGSLQGTLKKAVTADYHLDPFGQPVLHTTCEGASLSRIIQWFKTMTTNDYIKGVKTKNWIRFNRRLWQRNYYEHIIRNERAFMRIAKYIIDNPTK